MAGGGIPEAMLIGAAVGAGTGGIMSAAQDKDPLEGALLGAAMGAAGGGIGSGIGGLASGATQTGAQVATQELGSQVAQQGLQQGTQQLGQQTVSNLAQQGAQQAANAMGAMPTLASNQAATAALAEGSTQVAGQQLGQQAAQNWASQGLGQGMAPSLTNAQAYGAGAGGGIMGLIGNSQNQGEQWAPEDEYTGSLNYFKYNPQTFRPSVAPGYADGGVASLGRQTGMYPQSQIPDRTQFAVPSQMPTSREVVDADYGPAVNPYTGDMMMAKGGISSLGSYSDGGRMLKGPGDGMSDDIPGMIAGKQPARLADGEFVVPADVVSHLGNGSTDAGAKKLYSMMDSVRKARTGSKKQGKQIKAERHMPSMKSGGIAYYDEGGDTSSEPAATKADIEAAINAARGTPAGMSTEFQPSGYEPSATQYSPYTMANRPSSSDPQYYQDIHQVYYPDYSTPGYTLTGGNLGRWSNVAGEADRAAQPASRNQQVTQAYLQNLGRAPDTGGFEYWMGSGLSRPQLDQAFQQSGEYQAMQPGSVEDWYQRYLGRPADEQGLAFWNKQLGIGGPQAVRQAIANSEEAKIRNSGIASLV